MRSSDGEEMLKTILGRPRGLFLKEVSDPQRKMPSSASKPLAKQSFLTLVSRNGPTVLENSYQKYSKARRKIWKRSYL